MAASASASAKPLVVREFWPAPNFTVGMFGVAVVLFTAFVLERHPSTMMLALGGLAAALTALGIVSAMLHSGFEVSADRTVVETWWRFLIRCGRVEFAAADFTGVSLSPAEAILGRRPHPVFEVSAMWGRSDIRLERTTDYGAARRRAEQVARVLGVPPVDKSTAPSVVREAARLDEDVRSRLVARGVGNRFPAVPDGCRIAWSVDEGGASFALPDREMPQTRVLVIVGYLLLMALTLVGWHGDIDDRAVRAAVLVGGIAAGLVLIAVAIDAVLVYEVVHVDGKDVRVDLVGRVWTKTSRIPLARLEELVLAAHHPDAKPPESVVPDGTILHARSDEEVVRFGVGLVPAEAEWLHGALEAVIVKTSGEG